MKVKGVNLGNWLVLEKWMSPSLFEGTTAEDEYYLPTQLSREVYEARIKIHRSEYITERDFTRIKSMGMDAVRIPVPYFIFGDREPFIGCIEELDKAFCWAEKYGLQILIDLHTAPDSQNGFDNGGISGVCKWSQQPDEVEFELTVLERLAERYGKREGLWGIEVLNEPVLEDMWESMKVTERYPAADPEKAKGTKPNTMEFVREFYLRAYDRIRKHMPKEKYVVIHDAFKLKAWKDFMQEEKYKNVVLDTHQYLMMAELQGCPQTVEGYVNYIEENFEHCSLSKAAQDLGFSPKYLTMMLKNQTGKSFVEHIQSQKINKARHLLKNTDLPISQIVLLCGYTNEHFFYEKFKKNTGMTPAVYRMGLRNTVAFHDLKNGQ